MCPTLPAWDAFYEIAGRAYNIPDGYQIIRWDITAEELKNLTITRDRILRDAAQIIAKKYNLKTWVSINQLVKLSLTEWLGLTEDPFVQHYGYPDLIMQALAIEVEDLSREIDKKRKEQEMKMNEMVQKPTLDALATGNLNNSMNKVFR